MDWSLTHLEGMKENCIHEIKVNQPLSEGDLKDVEIIVNNTNINFNTTTNESVIVPEIPSFSKELLNDIEDVNCPNECNGNGKCEKGILRTISHFHIHYDYKTNNSPRMVLMTDV